MEQLNVIKFLKENSLESLQEKFAIRATRHQEFPNLISLKYSQIDSPRAHPIVVECRGIVVDEDDDWNVVSFPYKRFFNHGEDSAAKIDWNTARVYEKLDGSLMTLYYYDHAWRIASSGTPDASGQVMGFDKTFAELFWETWRLQGYEFPDDKNACYMFELMTPLNKVVVNHKESMLVLHGVRCLTSLKEQDPFFVARYNEWECAHTHYLSSWEDVVEAANAIKPAEGEGFVVCDSNYNRVKVKSIAYVALSHLRDNFTARRFLDIIRINESNEFLAHFPEFKDLYYDIHSRYSYLVGTIEGFYSAVKDIDDHKKFASTVKDQKFAGALFSLYNGKHNSVKEFLAQMNIRHLENWLKLKSE